MQYVPAARHSQALIAWLQRQCLKCDVSMYGECIAHSARLNGQRIERFGLGVFGARLLTPARADAWLREHIASEPMSLLHGVVP